MTTETNTKTSITSKSTTNGSLKNSTTEQIIKTTAESNLNELEVNEENSWSFWLIVLIVFIFVTTIIIIVLVTIVLVRRKLVTKTRESNKSLSSDFGK
jgi:heme/copper-type cytochrome/quinol oxidase subunit 2